MNIKKNAKRTSLPSDQIDLIEQFEADYNAIDKHLRSELKRDSTTSFSALISDYSRKHKAWRDAGLLRTISEVRNAIVHGKLEPYRYVAIPTPAIVEDLSACRDRLLNPDRVVPQFQRDVTTVSSQDSLATVMKLIAEKQFSQFPVRDDLRFRGLLTENGITRWLANHVTNEISLVELEDIKVEQVLEDEESRNNCLFVARDKKVEDVIAMFSEMPMLEAVIITASGREPESYLGIVTRWDIVGLG